MFKNLLGNFVEFENKEGVEQPKVPPTKPTINSNGSSPPVYDTDMLATLNKVISQRKTPYTALLEVAQKLEKTVPDEFMRIKAAFAIVSADGRSAENVIQAIDVHISDIDSEHMRFKNTTDQQILQKSQTLRERAKSLTEANDQAAKRCEELHKQLHQLDQQTANNNNEIFELTKNATAVENEIKIVYEKFKLASDHIKASLNDKKYSLTNTLRGN
jgi:DNA anti-recombination protein RmuC